MTLKMETPEPFVGVPNMNYRSFERPYNGTVAHIWTIYPQRADLNREVFLTYSWRKGEGWALESLDIPCQFGSPEELLGVYAAYLLGGRAAVVNLPSESPNYGESATA